MIPLQGCPEKWIGVLHQDRKTVAICCSTIECENDIMHVKVRNDEQILVALREGLLLEYMSKNQ